VLAAFALVIAVAALALSGWTWWQARSEPSYSPEQQSTAREAICRAFASVRTGVATYTHLEAPGGDGDVTGSLAIAANARGALMDGGQYLLTRLEPATPPDLADAVRRFANGLLDFGAAATAGAPNSDPDQTARQRDLDAMGGTLSQMCGV
jgi:hypothetical protein